MLLTLLILRKHNALSGCDVSVVQSFPPLFFSTFVPLSNVSRVQSVPVLPFIIDWFLVVIIRCDHRVVISPLSQSTSYFLLSSSLLSYFSLMRYIRQ